MHIPNHVLSCPVTYATAAAASSGIALAIKRLIPASFPQKRESLGNTGSPIKSLGDDNLKTKFIMLFAFIFVAQMVDMPISNGTTGHFFGGMLAALILGPWAASILMAVVLIAQCLFLNDGGLTALGANILNMAIIGIKAPLTAFLSHRLNFS